MSFLAAARTGLTFHAPLGEQRAAELIRLIAPTTDQAPALDLGCGRGEFLLRLCGASGITGDGVELDGQECQRGRSRAAELGLDARVRFHEVDATAWDHAADVVINVGAGHIWGTPAKALAALRRLVRPAGTVVFADLIFERPPAEGIREEFGDLPDLAALTEAAARTGFEPVHVAVSTLTEWDDFESAWRSGIERLGTPDALAFAQERLDGYVNGYRGTVGFAWLVLKPVL